MKVKADEKITVKGTITRFGKMREEGGNKKLKTVLLENLTTVDGIPLPTRDHFWIRYTEKLKPLNLRIRDTLQCRVSVKRYAQRRLSKGYIYQNINIPVSQKYQLQSPRVVRNLSEEVRSARSGSCCGGHFGGVTAGAKT